MFWILKSLNLVWNPNFCTILAYFLAASLLSSSDLAPVQTILPRNFQYNWITHHAMVPELNISAVVLGSLILMITAANLLGLYSAFLACRAIFFRSSLLHMLTVLHNMIK